MEGGPGSIVTRSTGMRSITEATSNTGWGIMAAPVMRQASIPAWSPKEWKKGLTIRYRSPRRSPTTSDQLR